MRRNPAAAPPTEPDDLAPQQRKREAIEEIQSLGVLYSVLNYLAPLVRFTAILTFLFGHESDSPPLGIVMAGIVMGMTRPALAKAGGRIAAMTTASASASAADPESSSRYHQLRLVWSQGLRAVLLVAAYAAAMHACDPRPCLGPALARPAAALDVDSLEGGSAPGNDTLAAVPAARTSSSHPHTSMELTGMGAAACVAFSLVWHLVQRVAPREPLAMAASMADGTHDLSSASEDEMLRAMPPVLRTCSLVLRLASVVLEAAADTLLLFVFLPSKLDDSAAPSALRSAPAMPALLVVGIAYGSQHLRFRGEWLLCAAYGLGLGGLAHVLGGELLPTLVGTALFAAFRHLRRTGLDVRRFHAQ